MNKSTVENIERKNRFINIVQHMNDLPLFSWIDLNLTELCNRKCVFCPRADPNAYPNQDLHISLDLVKSIAEELQHIMFQGRVVFCGYGEPLLHPRIADIVRVFTDHDIKTELVTNGDLLTSSVLNDLIDSGIDYIQVSLYDGEHQVDFFTELFKARDFSDYTLRDRWHGPEDDYGVGLTSRCQTVSVGNQRAVQNVSNKPCNYLAYYIQLDWNGDVLLCPHDWHKKIKFGNINNSSLCDIWFSSYMTKLRYKLLNGDRGSHPCNLCNADGTVCGQYHAEKWIQQANKQ